MMVPISSELLEGRMAADKTMGVQMIPKPLKRLRADLRKAEQSGDLTFVGAISQPNEIKSI